MTEKAPNSDFQKLRKRHLEEIRAYTPLAVERLSWSRTQVQEEQTLRLRNVIAQAKQSSSINTDRLGHVEASTFEVRDFVKLPPLS